MPGIFLSYARADGEDRAKELRERLAGEAPDIEIKQDRLFLEGRVGWWKQVTNAIDSVEFLILIMTPGAITSGNVLKEWRYARQQGVGCDTRRVPFMAPDLPSHFVERPREYEALKNLLLSADRSQSVAITTALAGAGGFGKTTLAAALCHDEDVIENFYDGILWTTRSRCGTWRRAGSCARWKATRILSMVWW